MATTTNLGLTLPTVGANDDTWGTVNNTVLSGLDAVFAGAAASATLASLLPNYISGLVLSAAGSTATFGIAVGAATDSANAAIMRLASAYTKTTSAWAVGTGNGALDTGAIANSTWYHVWLIQRSDTKVVDVLVSLSATAPTMPTNYDRKRRIGAMKTDGSAQWVKFAQIGDQFLWDTPTTDLNTTPSATAANLALTVPSGVIVEAIITGSYTHSATGFTASAWSPSVADDWANHRQVTTVAASNAHIWNDRIFTDTSKNIRYQQPDGVGTLVVKTNGWTDQRGSNG